MASVIFFSEAAKRAREAVNATGVKSIDLLESLVIDGSSCLPTFLFHRPWLSFPDVSNIDFEQLRQSAAENCCPILVAQPRDGENTVHRCAIPYRGIVSSYNDLARSDNGDQMPHVLGGKKHGVEIKLLEVFTGEFLQRLAILRKGRQALIVASRVRRQVAAAVRRANFEPGDKNQGPI